ncbi:MAG: methyl-accepting chemotaxis protein [Lachnospiraceae bacterium]|nr:methyl-accepting chemotaxis protein [Lachnospiraceae bacterium]
MKFIENIKLKYKITLMAVIPVLIMCVVALWINDGVVKKKLLEDTKRELKGTAEAVMAAYNQNNGDYFVNSTGDVWKGSYNVSLSETFIDDLSNKTGIDITFFYGSKRLVTSIVDKDGRRILDSEAGDFLKENVLTDGNDVFTNRVDVNGTMYYGYYIPVFQNNSNEIIGMIFAGKPVAQVQKSVNLIATIFIVSICAILFVTAFFGMFVASTISKPIKNSIHVLCDVANGNLNTQVNTSYLNRKDEVGDLNNSTKILVDNLTNIVGSINQNVAILQNSSSGLQDSSNQTSEYMVQVSAGIEEIADGATKQAGDTLNASKSIDEMGNIVEQTKDLVERLIHKSNEISRTSNEAIVVVDDLKQINNKTVSAINNFSEQINETNRSVENIKAFADIIADIASQTNLRALNASIEAARAGDAGRGFSVVAAEISKLAEESNKASGEITLILSELMDKSYETMKTMEEVKVIIRNQKEHVDNTGNAFNSVKEGVASSLNDITYIAEKTKDLVEIKNMIHTILVQLADVAENNAAYSEENNAITDEVANVMERVGEEVNNLNQITASLIDNIGYFK